LIVALPVHLFKGLTPPGPCFRGRPNHQLRLLDLELDGSTQMTLFDHRL